MIKMTCDKCGKELNWRKHPAFAVFDPSVFQHTYSCTSPVDDNNKEHASIQSITIQEKDGLRMLDLCDKCKNEIFDYIFFNTDSEYYAECRKLKGDLSLNDHN